MQLELQLESQLELQLESQLGPQGVSDNVAYSTPPTNRDSKNQWLTNTFSRPAQLIRQKRKGETLEQSKSCRVCLLCHSAISMSNTNYVGNVARHLRESHLSKNALNFTKVDPGLWSFAEDTLSALLTESKFSRGSYMFRALIMLSQKNVPLNFFERGDQQISMFVKPISARVMAKNLELLAGSIRTCNILFFRNVKSICLAFDGWSTLGGKNHLLA